MANHHMHQNMGPITLRNLPPEITKAIQTEAKKKKLSLNKAVICLLQKNLGIPSKKEKQLYHDLDKLAGSWSLKEAQLFEKTLTAQRTIDPEIWQ